MGRTTTPLIASILFLATGVSAVRQSKMNFEYTVEEESTVTSAHDVSLKLGSRSECKGDVASNFCRYESYRYRGAPCACYSNMEYYCEAIQSGKMTKWQAINNLQSNKCVACKEAELTEICRIYGPKTAPTLEECVENAQQVVEVLTTPRKNVRANLCKSFDDWASLSRSRLSTYFLNPWAAIATEIEKASKVESSELMSAVNNALSAVEEAQKDTEGLDGAVEDLRKAKAKISAATGEEDAAEVVQALETKKVKSQTTDWGVCRAMEEGGSTNMIRVLCDAYVKECGGDISDVEICKGATFSA